MYIDKPTRLISYNRSSHNIYKRATHMTAIQNQSCLTCVSCMNLLYYKVATLVYIAGFMHGIPTCVHDTNCMHVHLVDHPLCLLTSHQQLVNHHME